MTELLDVHSFDKVLEIGTGSGYQAAILSGTMMAHPSLLCHSSNILGVLSTKQGAQRPVAWR